MKCEEDRKNWRYSSRTGGGGGGGGGGGLGEKKRWSGRLGKRRNIGGLYVPASVSFLCLSALKAK